MQQVIPSSKNLLQLAKFADFVQAISKENMSELLSTLATEKKDIEGLKSSAHETLEAAAISHASADDKMNAALDKQKLAEDMFVQAEAREKEVSEKHDAIVEREAQLKMREDAFTVNVTQRNDELNNREANLDKREQEIAALNEQANALKAEYEGKIAAIQQLAQNPVV